MVYTRNGNRRATRKCTVSQRNQQQKKTPFRRKQKANRKPKENVKETEIPKNEPKVLPGHPKRSPIVHLDLERKHGFLKMRGQYNILTDNRRLQAMISVLGGYRPRKAPNPILKTREIVQRSQKLQEEVNFLTKHMEKQEKYYEDSPKLPLRQKRRFMNIGFWSLLNRRIMELEFLNNSNPDDDCVMKIARRVGYHKDHIKRWFNLKRAFPKTPASNFRRCLSGGYRFFDWRKAMNIIANCQRSLVDTVEASKKKQKPYGIKAIYTRKFPSAPFVYEPVENENHASSHSIPRKESSQEVDDVQIVIEVEEMEVEDTPMPSPIPRISSDGEESGEDENDKNDKNDVETREDVNIETNENHPKSISRKKPSQEHDIVQKMTENEVDETPMPSPIPKILSDGEESEKDENEKSDGDDVLETREDVNSEETTGSIFWEELREIHRNQKYYVWNEPEPSSMETSEVQMEESSEGLEELKLRSGRDEESQQTPSQIPLTEHNDPGNDSDDDCVIIEPPSHPGCSHWTNPSNPNSAKRPRLSSEPLVDEGGTSNGLANTSEPKKSSSESPSYKGQYVPSKRKESRSREWYLKHGFPQ